MNKVKPSNNRECDTPLQEVRKVREKLSNDAGQDVGRLIERARAIADELREKLGLKRSES